MQVTEKQLDILEANIVSRSASVRLVQRAKIIVLSFSRYHSEEAGKAVGPNTAIQRLEKALAR